MLLEGHWPLHKEMALYIDGKCLMLGNQKVARGDPHGTLAEFPSAEDAFRSLGVTKYTTLDPDGGDLQLDLNEDLQMLSRQYDTVYNLGTLEHVWDVHTAYANALRAVNVGGHFIGVSPVQGWDGHAVHITDMDAIIAMVGLNGFEVLHKSVMVEKRGVNLWLAARKHTHIDLLKYFQKPQQRYHQGKKEKAA